MGGSCEDVAKERGIERMRKGRREQSTGGARREVLTFGRLGVDDSLMHQAAPSRELTLEETHSLR